MGLFVRTNRLVDKNGAVRSIILSQVSMSYFSRDRSFGCSLRSSMLLLQNPWGPVVARFARRRVMNVVDASEVDQESSGRFQQASPGGRRSQQFEQPSLNLSQKEFRSHFCCSGNSPLSSDSTANSERLTNDRAQAPTVPRKGPKSRVCLSSGNGPKESLLRPQNCPKKS